MSSARVESTHINDGSADSPPPWYRQGWPWFLISIPLTSVLLGVLMITLAIRTDDALVVDDWYKQGKEINRLIERDLEAARLGLRAGIMRVPEGIALDLSTTAENFDTPAALSLRWVHATRAERDGRTLLQAIGGGRYLAANAWLPEQGRWRLHLEPAGPPAQDGSGISGWRLVSEPLMLQAGDAITLAPPVRDTAGR